jgi:predicted dehydrogenase
MKVGLIGLGAMGRMHFDCWRKSGAAQLAAISDRDPRKLAGDFGARNFNIGDQRAEKIDLSSYRLHSEFDQLIADPAVELVDICLPTPFHAPLSIAALRAGKHVFCEKPMSLKLDECAAMQAAARESGRQIMIGHCLRYWPHYTKAKELLASGEFGRAVYARFYRSSAMPVWSSGGWLQKAAESGGVLDMHIHDIDVALWWFGHPASIATTGIVRDGLPLVMDSTWKTAEGATLQLHGGWDANGGAFRHAFTLVMESGTLEYDLAHAEPALRLHRKGETTVVPIDAHDAYQAELDDFAAACAAGRPARVSPGDSQVAVEVGLEELRQLGGM